MSIDAQVGDDTEVIARPDPVDRTVADEKGLGGVPERSWTRPRHEDVIEPAIRPYALDEVGISADPGVTGVVADLRPAVVEHQPGDWYRASSRHQPEFVAVWSGVEISAEHDWRSLSGIRPESRRQCGQGSDLLLAEQGLVEAIGEVGGDHRKWAEGRG